MKRILSIIIIIALSTILGLAYNYSTNLDLRLLQASDDVRPLREDLNYNFEIIDKILTIADTDDATSFLLLAETITGAQKIKSDPSLIYDASTGTLGATYFSGDGGSLTNVGVSIATGLTIDVKEEGTDAIVKGQAVYVSGSAGVAKPLVGLADCNVDGKAHLIGLAGEAISKNGNGIVRVGGLLTGIDTFGANEVNPAGDTWSAGDPLYLSTTPGGLTNVRPTSGHIVEVGWSLYGSSNTDAILVQIDTPSHGVHVAADDDIVLRMGASDGSTSIIIKNFGNTKVAEIDDQGDADFNSLTLDIQLPINVGGTGVTTGAMTNFTSILNTALYVGRDSDNYISFDSDDVIKIKIGGTEHAIASISDGASDNDKLVTQGYVDDELVSALTDYYDSGEIVTILEDYYDSGEVVTILEDYYLKTAIDELSEVEAIYSKDIIDSSELEAFDYTDSGELVTALADYYLKTAIDELSELEAIWSKDVTDSTELASAVAAYEPLLVNEAGLYSALSDVTEFIEAGDDIERNYYSALGSDHTYSGNADTDSQPVGEDVNFGDLLYKDWALGEWMKAQADDFASTPALRIALESKGDSETCLMLIKGYIRDDNAFNFSASRIFLNDDSAGTCDEEAPAESGDQIQVVGTAISQRILFFDPSEDVGEI